MEKNIIIFFRKDTMPPEIQNAVNLLTLESVNVTLDRCKASHMLFSLCSPDQFFGFFFGEVVLFFCFF